MSSWVPGHGMIFSDGTQQRPSVLVPLGVLINIVSHIGASGRCAVASCRGIREAVTKAKAAHFFDNIIFHVVAGGDTYEDRHTVLITSRGHNFPPILWNQLYTSPGFQCYPFALKTSC